MLDRILFLFSHELTVALYRTRQGNIAYIAGVIFFIMIVLYLVEARRSL